MIIYNLEPRQELPESVSTEDAFFWEASCVTSLMNLQLIPRSELVLAKVATERTGDKFDRFFNFLFK